MIDYSEKRIAFWIELLGHEAVSVLSLLLISGNLYGTAEQISEKLHLRSNKLDEIKLLQAFGLASMSSAHGLHTVFSTEVRDVPAWGSFIQQLALAFDGRLINKSDCQKIRWNVVCSLVDAATEAPVRVGLGALNSIEIVTRSDRLDPRIIVNQNQRPNGSGFSFEQFEQRGDFVCLCSHVIGRSDVQAMPQQKLKLKPVLAKEEELQISQDIVWQSKSEDQWNAVDLSYWIMHRFFEIFGSQPPFNRVDLMRSGIMSNGVSPLARMQHNYDQKTHVVAYKKYVEWLGNHAKFQLVPSNLVSQRIIGMYVVDSLKQTKQTSFAIPEGYNVKG